MSNLRHPRVVAARRLARRAERDRTQTFLVEGVVAVGDAIAAGADLDTLFVRADAAGLEDLVAACGSAGARVVRVDERAIRAIAHARTPQAVIAVARMPRPPVALDTARLVLVLAGVSDPGNAGTLVRSAAAAGADAAFFTRGSVDPFHPKTVRAAAAALFSIPIERGPDAAQALAALRASGIRILGADAGASLSVDDADLAPPVAIVVGNEAHGISERDRAGLDATVAIPMPGRVESLNAAVAGSILLFEHVRRLRTGGR